MKRFACLLVFLLMSPLAVADSDNAAFVIWVEDACVWYMGDEGEIVSVADLHGVLVNHGLWSINCHGEVIEGTLPNRALVLHSPQKDDGLCCVYGLGCTETVHVTVTPSGESEFICHGEL